MSNNNINKLPIATSGVILDIEAEFYDDILSKCRKNKSNSCRHVLTNDTVYKIYMDEEERLYFKDPKNQGLFTVLERIACLEEIKETEDYKELLEFCIDNFRDTENNSISDFRKMKWIKFCEKNTSGHILTEALIEYNKRKRIEELKEAKIKELEESLVKELEEEEEEEEEEYEYTGYGIDKIYKVVINVTGGGLGNGNAYANIEGEWKTEDDFNDGEEGEIYYCEYGSYPSKRCVGTRIVWGDEDKFNIE